MPRVLGLARSHLRRLVRLARQAGTTPARVLRAVLRDGFDYTEWFVRRVNEGEADVKAGRVSSTTAVLTRSRAHPPPLPSPPPAQTEPLRKARRKPHRAARGR